MLTSEHIKYKDNTSYTSLLDILYPVGSIFITIGTTNPASHLGGSWIEVTDGVIAAKGYGTVGKNIGSKTIATTQLPSHTHTITVDSGGLHQHTHASSNNPDWLVPCMRNSHAARYAWTSASYTSSTRAFWSVAGNDLDSLSYDNWTGKYGTHTHTASAASTGGGKTICLIPMFATYEGEYLRGGIICLL